VFAAFGGKPGFVDPKGRLVYVHNGSNFILTKPINGEPACCANGGTIGFAMTPEQADAWHAAGLAHGGSACENAPGPREGTPFYLAYLRDPDGNKLCALHVIGN
jgi:catechol 2,3-dioxygenase-like lactoylglutathione lyase family enzyme